MKFLRRSHSLQICLLAAGVILLVVGVLHGEAGTVLMKAVYICLECIGIG